MPGIKHSDEIIQNHIEQLANINAILNVQFPIFEKKVSCIEDKIENLRKEIKNGIADKLDDFSEYIKEQKEKEDSRYETNAAGEKVLKERRVVNAVLPSVSNESWWSKKSRFQKAFMVLAALGLLKLESVIYLIESFWQMLKDMPT